MFRKKMIDIQHYITERLAADLRGFIKGLTYDKEQQLEKSGAVKPKSAQM